MSQINHIKSFYSTKCNKYIVYYLKKRNALEKLFFNSRTFQGGSEFVTTLYRCLLIKGVDICC